MCGEEEEDSPDHDDIVWSIERWLELADARRPSLRPPMRRLMRSAALSPSSRGFNLGGRSEIDEIRSEQPRHTYLTRPDGIFCRPHSSGASRETGRQSRRPVSTAVPQVQRKLRWRRSG
jgi:hypothetical protein